MASIHIIGTSHIAKQSVAELEQRILADKPDIVAVELDKQRFKSLFSERKLPGFSAIWRLGFLGFLFARIGGSLQKALGSKVGLEAGDDMKAAVNSAKKVNAKLALIDRPIGATLSDLSTKVRGWEKARFCFFLLGALLFPMGTGFAKKSKLRKLDLSKVPPTQLIDEVMKEVEQKFPMFYKVLVTDRNRYMAARLRELASKFPEARIIAAVGAGHEKEIAKLLSK